ncbi:MAG TPA: four helix bundle protein [Saprospiraceae bacterium]|nr:four helix bundle protein [Saprospiraceae bacterium]
MKNDAFNELFRKRTMAFVVRLIKFLESVPFNSATRVMSFQLCKAGTSVGANFRAFCRGRSKNEKFSKICIVVEEADETEYWLEIFTHTAYGDNKELQWLSKEANEILKVTSSIKNGLYN